MIIKNSNPFSGIIATKPGVFAFLGMVIILFCNAFNLAIGANYNTSCKVISDSVSKFSTMKLEKPIQLQPDPKKRHREAIISQTQKMYPDTTLGKLLAWEFPGSSFLKWLGLEPKIPAAIEAAPEKAPFLRLFNPGVLFLNIGKPELKAS